MTAIILILGVLAATAVALTLIESRTRLRQANEVPELGKPVEEPFCISASLSRCTCGHARAMHPRCLDGNCPCPRFVYAGGLVTLAVLDRAEHSALELAATTSRDRRS